MNRRGFLQAILASATAPYVVTTAGVLMPVRKILVQNLTEKTLEEVILAGGARFREGFASPVGVFGRSEPAFVAQFKWVSYGCEGVIEDGRIRLRWVEA